MKLAAYEEILRKAGATDEQMCYIADDLPDLPLLARVGLAVAVANAAPEVVLCESLLPDVAARDVLTRCQLRGIPIIFLGHGREVQDAVDLVRLGAIDFLEKPFPQSRLLDVLREVHAKHTRH